MIKSVHTTQKGLLKIFFSFFLGMKPVKRKATLNTSNRWMTVPNWMVCTNVFCVRAVQHLAHLTGGMVINIWVQLYLCK
jgi:hypothetical protein